MLSSTVMAHAEENKNKNEFRYTQLQDLEKEIEWGKLVEIITPYYQKVSFGCMLVSVETMLRVYFLQKRYTMSAAGVEDALLQIDVLRKFAIIDLEKDVVPIATCIEMFHSLVSLNGLESELNKAFNIEPITSEYTNLPT